MIPRFEQAAGLPGALQLTQDRDDVHGDDMGAHASAGQPPPACGLWQLAGA